MITNIITNRKVWNIARNKMWDWKWTNTVGKNGADWLARCRVVKNLQLVKTKNKKTRSYLQISIERGSNKQGIPVHDH